MAAEGVARPTMWDRMKQRQGKVEWSRRINLTPPLLSYTHHAMLEVSLQFRHGSAVLLYLDHLHTGYGTSRRPRYLRILYPETTA